MPNYLQQRLLFTQVLLDLLVQVLQVLLHLQWEVMICGKAQALEQILHGHLQWGVIICDEARVCVQVLQVHLQWEVIICGMVWVLV